MTPQIMIVGEQPSQTEANGGDFWDSRAGQLLEEYLEEQGFSIDEVYVTHAVPTRREDGKAPTKKMIKDARAHVEKKLRKIDPRFVVLLGNTPLLSLLDCTGIKKLRGKPIDRDGRIILPIYHPNLALHDEKWEPVIKGDLKRLRDCVDFGGIPEERDLDYIVVDTPKKVEAMLADLKGCVAADLETTRLYPFYTKLDELIEKKKASLREIEKHKDTHGGNLPRVVSIQFGTAKRQWVIPAETAGIWSSDELVEIVDRITDKLDDCFLVGHNWKFDALWMRVRFGVCWDADFDTMLAHYILDENDLHGLKELAQKYFGAPDWDIDRTEKTKWSAKNAKYAAHDVFYTRKLRFHLGAMLKEDEEVKRVFDKIMMPCSALFTEVEYRGIYLDLSKMEDAETYLREEVAFALANLEVWGKKATLTDAKGPNKGKINWGSAKQLGNLLFNDLGIKSIEKTAKGADSVSESVLNRIDHPMVGDLLKWRACTKQLSSFIEGWEPYIDTKGRLHPVFKLFGTVTGRLSCEHPNLQQVPRDPRIRTLITAPEGWQLIEMDLSQIELRIAAELADEHNMLMAFKMDIDVHWLTAIREIERGGGYHDEIIDTAYMHKQKKMKYAEAVDYILKIGPDAAAELMEMWKEIRKKAKAINFGYLYGMWWKKFKIYARDNYGVIIDDEQAQDSRVAFFDNYPAFPKWHKRQQRYAREHGYVKSLSGRKRRLPEAMSRHDTPQRREAWRQAINSPVQSFANELNLMAALQMREEFHRKYFQIVGTVHDATLFEVRNEWVPHVYNRGLEIMAHPKLLDTFEIELSVPLLAEGKIGPWGAGKKLTKWLETMPDLKLAA